jgi:hypothetical protein
MATKVTTDAVKISAHEKYAKKLEGELRSLKQREGTLPVSSKPMMIGKHELGKQCFLVVMGQVENESSLALLIHRPIGNDFNIPPDSWCVSKIEDVPKFISTRDHPGAAKLNANITKIKVDAAVTGSILEEKTGTGEYGYFGVTGTRTQHLDLAKNRKASYKAIFGKTPNTVCFMDPQSAKLEIRFQSLIIKGDGVMDKCKPLYLEMAKHRPHTLVDVTQVAAPYLYGKSSNEVVSSFFYNCRGMVSRTKAALPPDDYPVITVKIPLEVDIRYDDKEWALLSDALDKHYVLQKEYNILIQEQKSLKKKGSKAEKDKIAAEVSQKSDDLTSASDSVKAANITFAKTLFEEPEFTLVLKSELAGGKKPNPPVPRAQKAAEKPTPVVAEPKSAAAAAE